MTRKKDITCLTPHCRRVRKKQRRYCSRCITRQWRANNPDAAIMLRLRQHAKDRDIPFSLTTARVRELRLAWETANGATKPLFRRWAFSVDRIDARRGYTDDNVQGMTVSANSIKSNRERHSSWYRKQFGPLE